MATPQERLADALQALHDLQQKGQTVIRSDDLTRLSRERLQKHGFIRPIINGWYMPSRPDVGTGETTAWYASYWDFIRAYLENRFGDDWSLGPEQSVLLHAGQWRVPQQLLVRSPGGRDRNTSLLHGTSLYDARLKPARDNDVQIIQGLRVYSPEAALIEAGAGAYTTHPTELRTLLASRRDMSSILERLLNGGHSVIAGRIAGACRNIGREADADEIIATMRGIGYDVREVDPFEARLPGVAFRRDESPYANRIRLMWQTMRETVVARFPPPPAALPDLDRYMEAVEEIYVTDAYHSLSIEGYRVDAALIEKVRAGNWDPDNDAGDRAQRDALAARGYFDAFESVKESVRQVLMGGNPGQIAETDHRTWYRQLFGPSVTAGLIAAGSLAGYRNTPVYIRGSRHVPLNPVALRDAMAVLFDLLEAEADPGVRIVLGHFIFVYIHPYLDGNGRMGRFLMNLMFASGGYAWTVVPVQQRDAYMAALESASAGDDIGPFTAFLGSLVGKTPPAPPTVNADS